MDPAQVARIVRHQVRLVVALVQRAEHLGEERAHVDAVREPIDDGVRRLAQLAAALRGELPAIAAVIAEDEAS